jgi:hypothetical protein
MMKVTLSTPHHAFRNLEKGPVIRPGNFMMVPQICRFGYPQSVDPAKFTLITPFSSESGLQRSQHGGRQKIPSQPYSVQPHRKARLGSWAR